MSTTRGADSVSGWHVPMFSNHGEMHSCPACRAKAITDVQRRSLGLLSLINCPACNNTIRLKWGRALLATYLATCGALGPWIWSAAHFHVHSISLPPAFAAVTTVIVIAVTRGLPMVKD